MEGANGELRNWTPVQQKWLDRLASQFAHEVVLNQQFLNHRLNAGGGVKQLNLIHQVKIGAILILTWRLS